MLCDHQLVSEHLIDYIENRLSPTVHQQVESAIGRCESCQSTYHQAVQLHQTSHLWVEESVPEWHRTRYAVRPRQNAGNWLNWGALATSTLAILMVLFQVQISSNEQGVNIAFGSQNNAQLEALVNQKLDTFKSQQSLMLDARFVAEADKGSNATKLMLAEIINKTRDERREDLNFLITGIQTQRFEDQNKVEKRLAYLAENQIENNQYINQLVQSANVNKGDIQ